MASPAVPPAPARLGALACCDFWDTSQLNWDQFLSAKQQGPQSQGAAPPTGKGWAGEEGAAHGTWAGGGTAGQPWVTAMALPGVAAASAPGSALGTVSIPFGEVLEAEAEFVVVSEELWIVGDFRQENLCNF